MSRGGESLRLSTLRLMDGYVDMWLRSQRPVECFPPSFEGHYCSLIESPWSLRRQFERRSRATALNFSTYLSVLQSEQTTDNREAIKREIRIRLAVWRSYRKMVSEFGWLVKRDNVTETLLSGEREREKVFVTLCFFIGGIFCISMSTFGSLLDNSFGIRCQTKLPLFITISFISLCWVSLRISYDRKIENICGNKTL